MTHCVGSPDERANARTNAIINLGYRRRRLLARVERRDGRARLAAVVVLVAVLLVPLLAVVINYTPPDDGPT
jgi:hypothetical protein